jgi:hypothetical protein
VIGPALPPCIDVDKLQRETGELIARYHRRELAGMIQVLVDEQIRDHVAAHPGAAVQSWELDDVTEA